MKIALITDQHFGARDDSIIFHDYFEKFYKEVFFPYLKKHNINTVIDLGDTFDKRKNINYFSLKRSREYWFDVLKNNNITLHCIVGNHCTYFKNTNDINSPNLLLKEYDNIVVYDKATEVFFDNISISLIPWICQDNYDYTMNFIKKTKSQIAFGHFEIQGFKMYKSSVSKEGMDRNILKNYDVVCSGHFHHKSSIGSIFYLGSPYEIVWEDYGDDRGFHVFDTDTRSIEFIKNPYSMFTKLYYDDRNDINLNDFDFSDLKGTYVKIVCKNRSNQFLFEQYVDLVEKSSPHDLQIEDLTLLEYETEETTKEFSDTFSIIKESVDEIDFGGNKDDLLGLLEEIYIEAIQQ